jgi:hypothetical protein
MKKKNQQYFLATCGDQTYPIRCTRYRFRKKLVLQIEEQSFELPWGAREEIFRLGDEQAILIVEKNGKVAIRLRDGIVPECQE